MNRAHAGLLTAAWLAGTLASMLGGVSIPFILTPSTPLHYALLGGACIVFGMLFFGRMAFVQAFVLGANAYPALATHTFHGMALHAPLLGLTMVGSYIGITLGDEFEFGQALPLYWKKISLYVPAGLALLALGWYAQGI